jgi:hypothetical protein
MFIFITTHKTPWSRVLLEKLTVARPVKSSSQNPAKGPYREPNNFGYYFYNTTALLKFKTEYHMTVK